LVDELIKNMAMEDKETVIEENEMLKRHIRTQDTDLHTGA
jgi:hypothetical protein